MVNTYLRPEQVNVVNDTNAIANALEGAGIGINFVSSSLYFRAVSSSSCTIFTKSAKNLRYMSITIYERKDDKIHVNINYYNYDKLECTPEYNTIFCTIAEILFNQYGNFLNLTQVISGDSDRITLDFTY